MRRTSRIANWTRTQIIISVYGLCFGFIHIDPSGSQSSIKHPNCAKCIPNISSQVNVVVVVLFQYLLWHFLILLSSLCFFPRNHSSTTRSQCTKNGHESHFVGRGKYCTDFFFAMRKFFALWNQGATNDLLFFERRCIFTIFLSRITNKEPLGTIAISIESKGQEVNRSISLSALRSLPNKSWRFVHSNACARAFVAIDVCALRMRVSADVTLRYLNMRLMTKTPGFNTSE